MPPGYLKDFAAELGKVGDVVFKSRYRSPVLVVIGKTAELIGEPAGREKTMVAQSSPDGVTQMALVDRVFALEKAAHAPRGPIVLGRSGETDVSIPEYSISKRHCFFEFEVDGIKLTDCGSTNGTIVDGERIVAGEQRIIKDGSQISLGRFAFAFRTAAGFHGYLKSLRP
jgi:hypothetical protein